MEPETKDYTVKVQAPKFAMHGKRSDMLPSKELLKATWYFDNSRKLIMMFLLF